MKKANARSAMNAGLRLSPFRVVVLAGIFWCASIHATSAAEFASIDAEATIHATSRLLRGRNRIASRFLPSKGTGKGKGMGMMGKGMGKGHGMMSSYDSITDPYCIKMRRRSKASNLANGIFFREQYEAALQDLTREGQNRKLLGRFRGRNPRASVRQGRGLNSQVTGVGKGKGNRSEDDDIESDDWYYDDPDCYPLLTRFPTFIPVAPPSFITAFPTLDTTISLNPETTPAPTTRAPGTTPAPTTAKPTTAGTTVGPTTSGPTVKAGNPTAKPTTAKPTTVGTTVGPTTSGPTVKAGNPTAKPTTAKPTTAGRL